MGKYLNLVREKYGEPLHEEPTKPTQPQIEAAKTGSVGFVGSVGGVMAKIHEGTEVSSVGFVGAPRRGIPDFKNDAETRRELFKERVEIMVHDGELPREQAEVEARRLVYGEAPAEWLSYNALTADPDDDLLTPKAWRTTV